jgi:hypothetical protein
LAVGLEHIISVIAFAFAPSFSTTGTQLTLGGLARLADIVLEYIWLLAIMLVLAIKPVRGPRTIA